ncbi:hypothetical protein A2X44_05035 [candidate division CPR3 bacterium GWF2_35_18]|uniref:Uncharacterized protein n=1 Tax=candidate division CPR3 bacterium GW2011_GWF2_35_18 TaxID=1618350 RepID=A0A0G0C120_UNCC3|nr:MAG: hypothetical protein UR67_C0003G0084 [candidate division CPR3 bacterium GW2011_GWF2_35_18]KKP87258.1 MAG: hypothetical protein UR87_C0001G0015 [candidate division CPR3 bacterium GW2011_GWE2_35_7]OGB63695.1 MAG: hypothetical protein A2X44_05035 [candidate division CPR3 bacterium GWF2_35_18]OGB64985.1 MAG: hypothetical protein A2250_01010 [candidate division CPR3 bacterium RIFOXYA2_FULL_35_13]OGB76876.1 MAG: hypothetical protein A2476_04780 [candidate division CPR3 bacterium RIFOXYC2_FULL
MPLLDSSLLNPYVLFFGGIVMIIFGLTISGMKPTVIIEFWMRFLLYFFKNPNKYEREQEKNPSFSFGGWIFLFGWFLIIAGIIRFLGLGVENAFE